MLLSPVPRNYVSDTTFEILNFNKSRLDVARRSSRKKFRRKEIWMSNGIEAQANKINVTVTVLETMTLAPLDAEKYSWNVSTSGLKCRLFFFFNLFS